jgi:hypothetical protein
MQSAKELLWTQDGDATPNKPEDATVAARRRNRAIRAKYQATMKEKHEWESKHGPIRPKE